MNIFYVKEQLKSKVYSLAGADHIVFGTDVPLQGAMQMRFAIEAINALDIPQEDGVIHSSLPQIMEKPSLSFADNKEEKSYRLQMLLKAMIADAVSENNRELGNDIKEIVQKEMDYQFRMQEEREEEREKLRIEREDGHYSRIDELLREKLPSKRKKHSLW